MTFFEQTDSFLSKLWHVSIWKEIITEESCMRIQQPIPHWNNFTVSELKQILVHCRALERLGIAQDEEMIISIERDITMREKKISTQPSEPKLNENKTNRKTKAC